MAKIKHTKNELKAQSESLKRFERFLPMLQLKKQQLQAEIQGIDSAITEKAAEEKSQRAQLEAWVALFAEPADLDTIIGPATVQTGEDNIAGVAIPVLQSVQMSRADYDLFDTPSWVDDALDMVQQLTELRIAREVLEEQRRRIVEELRVTSQRVNLFEKVKIPECRENIRVIKIFLGDEQTAAVARGKIAKKRSDSA
ncbi:MAG: V-type ATP synthase subunit D [Kiritimatiellia bacterium]|jgi:V/A-type H+-transporting ATPase subunit D|nr:V-type ATP synthase subunit D [Kiritimatiellia bacterium]MDP6631091.1 V-type ATP synthase subunit D [Kiritimatiellia bacterium]MDP6810047.1 V-type ATP synthase subunit D [Kiritimatiellia bacterium]MDP7024818.1 V-type ATP synthase subunit D [Kiritimatiellia bacterium]